MNKIKKEKLSKRLKVYLDHYKDDMTFVNTKNYNLDDCQFKFDKYKLCNIFF